MLRTRATPPWASALENRRVHARSDSGFSMTEMLLVLVILMVLAGIAIPTLINGLDRGKQKRTMADIRAVGGALEAYSLDHSTYPVASDMATAAPYIEAQYMTAVRTRDAWNNLLVYNASPGNYTLGSAGKDGGSSLTLVGGGGPMQNFKDDIIYTQGTFIQWPEGAQR